MNTLIVLLDGAADDKVPELSNKTPLEYLSKRFIDHVASTGTFGVTDGREYTHLFLLEYMTGKAQDVPRGLIEAVGLGVPVKNYQIAYRFSPVKMDNDGIDWLYRVSREQNDALRDCMVRNLDVLNDLNPRIYFYEDGRGVMTVESSMVQNFPQPPTPVNGNVRFGDFELFIRRLAREMNGVTILPWGGGSMNLASAVRPTKEAKSLAVVSKSPSALGVAGFLGLHREQVDDMWSGFNVAFRLLKGSNVLMHVEETDDVSHRRSPDQKVALLREVDDFLMEHVDELTGYRVAFIVDHGTSSVTGQHIRMRTPFAVAEVTEPEAPKVRFCEKATKHVPLPQLMPMLLG